MSPATFEWTPHSNSVPTPAFLLPAAVKWISDAILPARPTFYELVSVMQTTRESAYKTPTEAAGEQRDTGAYFAER